MVKKRVDGVKMGWVGCLITLLCVWVVVFEQGMVGTPPSLPPGPPSLALAPLKAHPCVRRMHVYIKFAQCVAGWCSYAHIAVPKPRPNNSDIYTHTRLQTQFINREASFIIIFKSCLIYCLHIFDNLTKFYLFSEK